MSRFISFIVIIVLFVGYLSVYTIYQTDNGILLRLGEIETTSTGDVKVVKPGLHFKLPFVESVLKFDMRLRTLPIDSSRIVTEEQKDVIVDAFAKWRINDIAKYYKATKGNDFRANQLLQQMTNDAMRAEFGKMTIQQLIAGERANVMGLLKAKTGEMAQSLGVTIIDVRIKRIDLPTEVTDSVYARMRSNREKVASKIRAEGQERAEQIRSQADAKVTIIVSKAMKDAAIMRAEGDGAAAKMYAQTYQKSPKFYSFFKSLESYQNVFASGKQNLMVLEPEGAFFSHFNEKQLTKK